MEIIEWLLMPNVLYLLLVAGMWLAALAVVTPGTGVLEALALVVLLAVGWGTLRVPFNGWAVAVLALGVIAFGVSIWKRSVIVLAVAAIILSLASVFLFRLPEGGPAVHPALASAASLLTLGFFWLSVRKAMLAHRGRPVHDLASLVGQVGEVRTPLDPVGSVYLAGELWTATAETTIPRGAQVRVVGREGLILNVQLLTGQGAESTESGGTPGRSS